MFRQVVQDVEISSRRRAGSEVDRNAEDVNVAGNGKLRPDQRRRQRFARAYQPQKVEHKDRSVRLGRAVVKVLEAVDDFTQRQVLSDDVGLQDRVQRRDVHFLFGGETEGVILMLRHDASLRERAAV